MSDRHDVVAGERLASCEHFVQHRAHAEEVASGIDVFADHLFGAHVAGRAKDLAVHR